MKLFRLRGGSFSLNESGINFIIQLLSVKIGVAFAIEMYPGGGGNQIIVMDEAIVDGCCSCYFGK
jgi:hypothetical protein